MEWEGFLAVLCHLLRLVQLLPGAQSVASVVVVVVGSGCSSFSAACDVVSASIAPPVHAIHLLELEEPLLCVRLSSDCKNSAVGVSCDHCQQLEEGWFEHLERWLGCMTFHLVIG